jgi:hypothetical protein
VLPADRRPSPRGRDRARALTARIAPPIPTTRGIAAAWDYHAAWQRKEGASATEAPLFTDAVTQTVKHGVLTARDWITGHDQ